MGISLCPGVHSRDVPTKPLPLSRMRGSSSAGSNHQLFRLCQFRSFRHQATQNGLRQTERLIDTSQLLPPSGFPGNTTYHRLSTLTGHRSTRLVSNLVLFFCLGACLWEHMCSHGFQESQLNPRSESAVCPMSIAVRIVLLRPSIHIDIVLLWYGTSSREIELQIHHTRRLRLGFPPQHLQGHTGERQQPLRLFRPGTGTTNSRV